MSSPGTLNPGCEVAIPGPGPAGSVGYAEQDTLLDCLNEEIVYLSSTSNSDRGNSDRGKHAQFLQEKKYSILMCRLCQFHGVSIPIMADFRLPT